MFLEAGREHNGFAAEGRSKDNAKPYNTKNLQGCCFDRRRSCLRGGSLHAPPRGLLELGLKRTALYKWKLVQVAKKFGAIDPDADYDEEMEIDLCALEPLVAFRRSTPSPDLDLSEQQLVDCASTSLGCDAGGLTWGPAASFLSRTGVTSEACYPYTSGSTGQEGSCIQASASRGTLRRRCMMEST